MRIELSHIKILKRYITQIVTNAILRVMHIRTKLITKITEIAVIWQIQWLWESYLRDNDAVINQLS